MTNISLRKSTDWWNGMYAVENTSGWRTEPTTTLWAVIGRSGEDYVLRAQRWDGGDDDGVSIRHEPVSDKVHVFASRREAVAWADSLDEAWENSEREKKKRDEQMRRMRKASDMVGGLCSRLTDMTEEQLAAVNDIALLAANPCDVSESVAKQIVAALSLDPEDRARRSLFRKSPETNQPQDLTA